MPESDKSPSVFNKFFWIFMPLLGILLMYLLSRYEPVGFFTQERIDKISVVGYVVFGYALLYRIFCYLVLDAFLTQLLKRPIPGIVYNSLLLLGALVTALVSLDILFEGAIAYILTLSGVIGVVIGLALRPIILDIFSGISTHLDAAFQIGDWVEVHESVDKAGYSGFIEEINWRTMLIRTKAGNYLICPNSLISTSLITNYSRPNCLSRFEISLQLPANFDTKRVLRLLQTAADATKHSELGPCPEMEIKVFVEDLKDAAIHYMVRYWIDRRQHSYRGARHRILQSIQQHLIMAGIPLADNFIKNLDSREIYQRGYLPSKQSIFEQIELFQGISPELIIKLTEQSEECVFDAGEAIITQGAEDDAMFIMLEGGVEVVVDFEGAELVVDEMFAGDYFGEMSLLTDSPRTATIRTRTPCRTFKVSRKAIQQLFDADQSILPLLSENLAKRNLNRSQKVASAKGELENNQKKSLAKRLLEKMTAVFT